MLSGQYDAPLVLLSFLIAMLASFVALDLAGRIVAARSRGIAAGWLCGGALAMGSGVWAMHFIGMLAFSLPIPLAYELYLTLASLLVAVLSSAVALYAASRASLSHGRLLGAGVLMGLGIAAMHYLGMEAMQMYPRIAYDPLLFALSVGVAIVAATVALWISFRLRHGNILSVLRQRLASSAVMGVAIAGMHYTGMASAGFAAGSVCGASRMGLGTGWLAVATASLVALLLVAVLLSSVYAALPPTVRSRLVFLVLSVTLPLSLLTLLFVGIDFNQRREQQFSQLLATTRAVMGAVDKDLATIEAGLLVLSTSPLLADENYAGFHGQAGDALLHLQASAITLGEANGALLIDTRRPYGEALPWSENAEHARRIFETGKPAISDFFVGKLDAEPLINVGVPVWRGQRVAYQVNASIRSERLSTLIRQQQLPGDWIAAVFDRQGRVIARSHEMHRFVGMKGSPQLLAALEQNDEGWVEAVTLEGLPVVSVFSRSPRSGWSFAIGVPRSAVSAPVRQALGWLFAGFVLLLGLGLLLAWRIGGTIAGALQALSAPALALGSGTPPQVPPLGLVEADEIGRSLNQAGRLLGDAQHDANHDGLTGLANRGLFSEVVRQQLAIARRRGGSLAVLFIDLDGFKDINDGFGHAAGDALLVQVAGRLREAVREGDVVARLGGDEFAVALLQAGAEGAALVAGKLVQLLARPYHHDGAEMRVSASMGAALYPQTAADLQTLLDRADAAMYAAKKSGKNRYVMADPLS